MVEPAFVRPELLDFAEELGGVVQVERDGSVNIQFSSQEDELRVERTGNVLSVSQRSRADRHLAFVSERLADVELFLATRLLFHLRSRRELPFLRTGLTIQVLDSLPLTTRRQERSATAADGVSAVIHLMDRLGASGGAMRWAPGSGQGVEIHRVRDRIVSPSYVLQWQENDERPRVWTNSSFDVVLLAPFLGRSFEETVQIWLDPDPAPEFSVAENGPDGAERSGGESGSEHTGAVSRFRRGGRVTFADRRAEPLIHGETLDLAAEVGYRAHVTGAGTVRLTRRRPAFVVERSGAVYTVRTLFRAGRSPAFVSERRDDLETFMATQVLAVVRLDCGLAELRFTPASDDLSRLPAVEAGGLDLEVGGTDAVLAMLEAASDDVTTVHGAGGLPITVQRLRDARDIESFVLHWHDGKNAHRVWVEDTLNVALLIPFIGRSLQEIKRIWLEPDPDELELAEPASGLSILLRLRLRHLRRLRKR